MGTRSLTHFVDDCGQKICTMYRQMDGYLEGHGQDLAKYLKDFVIVSGYNCGDERKIANGMGDLACQVVCHFKKALGGNGFNGKKMKTLVGGVYLEPPTATDCGQEYEYIVSSSNKGSSKKSFLEALEQEAEPVIEIKGPVDGHNDLQTLFEGTAKECVEFIKKYRKERELD